MPEPSPSADLYLHVRVMISMILGLSIARLLNGLTRFVQHPAKYRVWWPHLVWVSFAFLSVTGFWWWEFRLAEVREWTFEAYLFVIAYVAMLFVLCTLLFPDDITEYAGFEDYFMSRRRWFFGVLAATFLMDVADTWLKGVDYLEAFGLAYPLRIAGFLALCAAGTMITRPKAQGVLALVALAGQALFLLAFYSRLI